VASYLARCNPELIGGGGNIMHYAYGPSCEGWIEDRKFELARNLQNLVARYGKSEELAEEGPYVEVDESGVRLRRVTSLSEDEQEKLRKQAERIYWDIMRPAASPARV
jgi:hypothetical protein